ncbi:TFIIA-alpha and beta-like factor [Ambystoma mexicanum]|uniref:TFIIA-alpha and beta-like factor n=1 Tax=Ambystoma mexicanum TaxID=8296 RepID=UPI0037E7949C
MAHSMNANPVPKLYRSIIEDVIDNVAEIFAEEGIDEQVLKDLRQLWESKVMQSKATEGFFRDHHSTTQFVLQLPQALQTSASLVIPAGRNVRSFTSAQLRSSGSSTTFTLPPGMSYPIHVPAGVTLQTASGHLYKVNVPVMVTQTSGGPRILQHQQLFQHLGPSSYHTAVSQIKTASERVLQKPQQQEPFAKMSTEFHVLQKKEVVNGNILENSNIHSVDHQFSGTKQCIPTNVNLSQENASLEEQDPVSGKTVLSMSNPPDLALDANGEHARNGLISTYQSIQEQLSLEPNIQVPHTSTQSIVLDESESLTQKSCSNLSDEVPSIVNKTQVQNNIEIIQIDGTGDTSSDEEIGTVRDVEENEFLGIIDTEDLKALEECDSVSNDDSTSNSSDDEDNEIDAIEEDPLNSGDDVSEQEVPDLFDTENVIVCQYDKIHRSKNKWKFYLKDGVMSFGGKDYVFSKAIGEAEW